MSVVKIMIGIPAKHERNVCEQFDTYLKKVERTLHMTMIARGGEMKTIGPEETVDQTEGVFNNLIELSKRGNTITKQNMDHALSLSFTENDGQILGIDRDIMCRTAPGKPVKSETLGQKHYVDATRKRMVVFGIGPTGTGKTYLAMAMIIQAFKNGEVGRTILTKPAIEAGKKLRFLPGDLQGKIGLYLCPLCNALYQIMGAESYLHNPERGLIEVTPLVYVRGRTLDNTYITLDEIQDITPVQMEMFLTRIDFGSRVIITGDQAQKDLPGDAVSGLDTVLKVLKQIDGVGSYYPTNSDVVRRPLMQKIVQAYEAYKQKDTPSAGWRKIRGRGQSAKEK